MKRRTVITALASALSVPLINLSMPYVSRPSNKPRVVIVGGGAGGASLAHRLARESYGNIDVTLIDQNAIYETCFFSNFYLASLKPSSALRFDYSTLVQDYGLTFINDKVVQVNRAQKRLKLSSGQTVSYDRLVLSPGIDMNYDALSGYTYATSLVMPHAWKLGGEVRLLKQQLQSMRQGGVVVIVPPPNPYRCPPGPYERASLMAHWLKQHNPSAKIIILDPKSSFSKQTLFEAGWDYHYPGMIEWFGPDVHGGITHIDAKNMTIETDFDSFEADVANVIPPQKAAQIAYEAELTEGDWIPINPKTMTSQADVDTYVLGDSAQAASMPKSAASANSQAEIVTRALKADLLNINSSPSEPYNICWSTINPHDSIQVSGTYTAGLDKFDRLHQDISQPNEGLDARQTAYQKSEAWFHQITQLMFG